MLMPTQMGEAGRGLVWSHSGLYSLHSLVEDDQGLWWENEVIIIMTMLMAMTVIGENLVPAFPTPLLRKRTVFGQTMYEVRLLENDSKVKSESEKCCGRSGQMS